MVTVETAWFQDLRLDREQRHLLATLVEASRSVERSKLHPFLLLSYADIPAALTGPGLNSFEVQRADLRDLCEVGLLRDWVDSSGTANFEVTRTGRHYYEWAKGEDRDPSVRLETEIQNHLDASVFQSRHRLAYDRWVDADAMLWGAESESSHTQIGHLCREAMQEFATDAVKSTNPAQVDSDITHVENRIAAAIDAKRGELGGREAQWLRALIAYWRSVSDLAQRQEHGSRKARRELTWEDSRRVVFQTAIAMFEIDRALY